MAKNIDINGNTYHGVSVLQVPLTEDPEQVARFVEADEIPLGGVNLPDGGRAGQVLAKLSDDDQDVGWADPPEDGATPGIGENGNWLVGDRDTGVAAQGPRGEDGESAYAQAVAAGYGGSEEDFCTRMAALGNVVILTQGEYYALADAGALDEGTLYFVTEDVSP